MILASGRAAPLRFLLTVAILWVGLRAAMLAGWQPAPLRTVRWGPAPGALLDIMPRLFGGPTEATPTEAGLPAVRTAAIAASPERWTVSSDRLDPRAADDAGALALLSMAAYLPDGRPAYTQALDGEGGAARLVDPGRPPDPASALDPAPADASARRFSGSAWVFARAGDAAVTPLAPQGRIGGGQAGARLLYAIDRDRLIAVSARVTGTVEGPRQTEAALGLDARPFASVPVHLTVERRIAIDRGGRDAWAAGATGGVYAVPIARNVRMDGYAQAGIVGARRRDLYGDGALRVGRELPVAGRGSLTLGGGAWGAAQPRAARLDAGPTAVLRWPLTGTTIAAALDYRARVAGEARPGSGPAFTLGVDF